MRNTSIQSASDGAPRWPRSARRPDMAKAAQAPVATATKVDISATMTLLTSPFAEPDDVLPNACHLDLRTERRIDAIRDVNPIGADQAVKPPRLPLRSRRPRFASEG